MAGLNAAARAAIREAGFTSSQWADAKLAALAAGLNESLTTDEPEGAR